MPLSMSLCIAAVFSSLLVAVLGQVDDGFQNPSPEYRPKFRYWMPDASVSPEIIAKDFEALKTAGAGGLEYLPFYLYGQGKESFHRYGWGDPELPDWSKYGFGQPEFVSLFKSSLQSAQDNDILMDYALGANQGQGVPSEVETPGLAVELLMGNTTISPHGSFSAPVPQARQPSAALLSGLTFMHPLEQFGTPNLTAVIAYQVLNETAKDPTKGTSTIYLNQSSFLDLTPLVKDGWSLQWTPPDTSKTWKILSFWEAFTNQRSCDGGPNATTFLGNGSWTVDHFSKIGAARVTDFWDQHLLSDDELASLLKSVGKYAWEDSMEILAALYWSPGLLDRFEATHGYTLTPYLPLLFSATNSWNGVLISYNESYAFGGDANVGNSAYQLNYRSILNDGYQNYLSHFREWSHSIGTEYSAQPAYNLPLQMFSDIPLVDAPEGESLGFGNLADAYRQFAGPAHLYNKSDISTELGAVNTPAYSLRIPDLLQQVKRSLAGGFTMHVLHGFPTSTSYPNTTWPGYTTFFYEFTEMWNQIQPVWQHMKDSLDYIGRNQWALHQGTPQVDLAFYLHASPWAPKTQYNSQNLNSLGFTYDYLGPDNLVSSEAFVKDNALGIPQYKALIFNNQTVTTIEAAEALISMTSSGLPLIFVGSTLNQSYPVNTTSQTTLSVTMSRLLSEKNVHQTSSVDQLPSLLADLGITPRASLKCSSNPVYSVWRSAGDIDYVYFFNDQNVSTTCTATLSVSQPITPYIYNAYTGSQTRLLTYSTTNSSLTFPLSLKSNETLLLALHHTSTPPTCHFTSASPGIFSLTSSSSETNSSSSSITALLTGPATLTFPSNKTISLTPPNPLPSPTTLTTWDLVISDWHSAPDRYAIETEITNHTFRNTTLRAWKDIDAAMTNVSGIGYYSTNLVVPALSSSSFGGDGDANANATLTAIIHLPPIQHTARARLSSTALPPIDPTNPTLLLHNLTPGSSYTLEIEVTTTLFNRIKADRDVTWVAGQVASKRQGKYANMGFEGYGLVGVVDVVWGVEVGVEVGGRC